MKWRLSIIGYNLWQLEDDFRVLYPGKEQNLYKKWSKLENFILERLDKKKQIHVKKLNTSKYCYFPIALTLTNVIIYVPSILHRQSVVLPNLR